MIKETCIEISKRYELYFLEIGTDKEHVHFLIQSMPRYSPAQIAKIVKSITAKEVLERCLEVKKKLWGGNSWSSGYYVATVSEHGNEEVKANYVKNRGMSARRYYEMKGWKDRYVCLTTCKEEMEEFSYPVFEHAKASEKGKCCER